MLYITNLCVEEAGLKPAFMSKPYKPIIRGFEPPPCAHHCASVTPYYQFNMCVYHSAIPPNPAFSFLRVENWLKHLFNYNGKKCKILKGF